MKTPIEALRAWGLAGPVRPADDGLINRTYLVGPGPEAVLQWVNPIFDPKIQLDIDALTRRLDAQGLATPTLWPTHDDRLLLEDEEGFWRVMSYMPGTTIHRLASTEQAHAAGELLGRFHGAVKDWQWRLQAPTRNIHETPRHMSTLRSALESCDGHPLESPARELGRQVLDAWASWQGAPEQPDRFCHGDPKISNLRFDASGTSGLCMLDLDTIGPQELAGEMGDAWRSWCNPAGEEDPESCRFDLELFRASALGWRSTVGRLEDEELQALVPAIERICLELAARFCADAVMNSYFRENRKRYPQPGSHNLLKARCQKILADDARRRRSECEKILTGEVS